MHARFIARPKQLIYSSPPDFPCLADEIAEPRPDINIKVAGFTVSEKSINMKSIKLFNRGSRMSALVLFNLLNELAKKR